MSFSCWRAFVVPVFRFELGPVEGDQSGTAGSAARAKWVVRVVRPPWMLADWSCAPLPPVVRSIVVVNELSPGIHVVGHEALLGVLAVGGVG